VNYEPRGYDMKDDKLDEATAVVLLVIASTALIGLMVHMMSGGTMPPLP
jgi:hypothetical protein